MLDQERIVDRETVQDYGFIHIDTMKERLPNGVLAPRTVVVHGGGASVLPLDEKGNVILVQQYRIAFDEDLLEIPAGKLEAGEDPLECVRRELREETGYQAEHIEKWMTFYPTVGFCTEVLHVFFATGLSKGESQPDEDEFVNIVRLPLSEFIDRVDQGEIRDGKTVIAALIAKQRLC